MPPVLRWARVEPTTRSVGMESGLSADVCDAAWLLGRQWQLGEFRGEDAGSPVRTHLQMECTPLTRYLPGGVPDSWFSAGTTAPQAPGQRIDTSVPLEAVVERERIRVSPLQQPRLAAEAGLYFLRLLAAAGLANHRPTVTALSSLQPMADAPDPATARFSLVMARRVPDGAVLAHVLDVVAQPASLASVPEAVRTRVGDGATAWKGWMAALTVADRTKVDGVVASWRRWAAALFSEPTGTSSSWISERLEYEFAVSSPTPQREVLLTAPEYVEGRLDWYSFDSLTRGSLGAARPDLPAADAAREVVRRVAIPTPVQYPGMPAARYWQFEDARVDFGALPVDAQRLAQMILVEFALISGDDWFVIPVDMAVGSIATVRWLVVTDTFGERTLVRSARVLDRERTNAEPVWDMFHVQPDARQGAVAPGAAPDVFLMPAALGPSLHGKPLEEVALLRDEMANMAWAVERTVESAIGLPLDRAEAAHRQSAPQPPASPLATGEQPPLVYRLSTDVPAHWLPLYPARIRADAPPVRLRRGGAPQGRILEPWRTAAGPLLINEEEVPREGARVTRSFQYARWIDGSTHLWVGRRKRTGRGEGSSGLRFDVLEPAR